MGSAAEKYLKDIVETERQDVNDLQSEIASAADVIRSVTQRAHQRRLAGIMGGRVSASQLNALKRMRDSSVLSIPRRIGWPAWPAGCKSKAVALVQAAMRKLGAWLLNPVVQQQNEFNQATINAITALVSEMIEGRRTGIKELRELQEQMRVLERDIQSRSEQDSQRQIPCG